MSYIESKIWAAHSEKVLLDDLPTGLDYFYDATLGFFSRLIPRKQRFLSQANKVIALDSKYSELSEKDLKIEIYKLKEIFLLQKENYKILIEAFAVIREVCFRTLQMKPYKVQVAGGLAITAGFVAEMATGEGKTLTATMPGVIAGWRGKGCHIMSSNSYLAARDAEEMRPVYEYCGLSVDSLKEDSSDPADRKNAYSADITYCTNGDVAADFLRDQLALGNGNSPIDELLKKVAGIEEYKPAETVLRGLEYAIIDETDSVMIDDGVTPLLISGESGSEEKEQMYLEAKQMAELFHEGEEYFINEKFKEIVLLPKGLELLNIERKKLGIIWKGQVRSKELINQALNVRHFFIKDKQYIIDDEKIVIVDEATGRLMPDRFWRSGTHQAVEAKEGVKINPDKETFARISFQKFFRLYKKASGMTGTAKEASSEFWRYYHLLVVSIPTNRKCLRVQHKDQIYLTEEQKWNAIIEEIKIIHKTNRPILVGTGNIKDSEALSKKLNVLGLTHTVLNAIYHKQEADIVKDAGIEGSIVIATNMAGRGTDIKLTQKSKDLGGLHVIATDKFESSRIDRQLYGRSSRQGDPGSAVAIISLEDLLVRKYLGPLRFVIKYLSTPLSFKGKSVIPNLLFVFKIVQFLSVLQGRKQRKSVSKSDTWLKETLGFAGKDI